VIVAVIVERRQPELDTAQRSSDARWSPGQPADVCALAWRRAVARDRRTEEPESVVACRTVSDRRAPHIVVDGRTRPDRSRCEPLHHLEAQTGQGDAPLSDSFSRVCHEPGEYAAPPISTLGPLWRNGRRCDGPELSPSRGPCRASRSSRHEGARSSKSRQQLANLVKPENNTRPGNRPQPHPWTPAA
jgi:hypothetical protein